MVNPDMTQPYKVRTGCGHIVVRRMRPATAGVPFTPETVLEAPNGRPCPECESGKPKPQDSPGQVAWWDDSMPPGHWWYRSPCGHSSPKPETKCSYC